jgi:hypothetical protein
MMTDEEEETCKMFLWEIIVIQNKESVSVDVGPINEAENIRNVLQ